MSILYKHNIHDGSEREMQDDVVRLILQNRKYNNEDVDIFEEVHIPEIGRRSDIIIRLRRTYFNVECKLVDVLKVLEQARDHLKWANYSYICLQSDAYIAPKYIREMTDIGIGLLLWEPGVLMECVQAPSNKLKNRIIREQVIDRLPKVEYGHYDGKRYIVGTRLTSDESGKLIVAPEGTPEEEIVVIIKPDK